MDGNSKVKIFIGLGIIIVIVLVFIFFKLSKQKKPPPPSLEQLFSIQDVSLEGFIYNNSGLFMKFKIYGKGNLKKPIVIDKMPQFWLATIKVILPDGREAEIYNPGDYAKPISYFDEIDGEKIIDVKLPIEKEDIFLEGSYNFRVYLATAPIRGYPQKTKEIFNKRFELKTEMTGTIEPSEWSRWDEILTIGITNNGDLPLKIKKIRLELKETKRVVGEVKLTPETGGIFIMPGETKRLVGTPMIFEQLKKDLSEKTLSLDFLFEILGSQKEFLIEADITFPSQLKK